MTHPPAPTQYLTGWAGARAREDYVATRSGDLPGDFDGDYDAVVLRRADGRDPVAHWTLGDTPPLRGFQWTTAVRKRYAYVFTPIRESTGDQGEAFFRRLQAHEVAITWHVKSYVIQADARLPEEWLTTDPTQFEGFLGLIDTCARLTVGTIVDAVVASDSCTDARCTCSWIMNDYLPLAVTKPQ